MKYIKIIITLILGIKMGAQELPKIIPPGPEANSMIAHSKMDVSLYTGKPNISVPIYNVELDGLMCPISLSYDIDGIRVSEIASEVGLGWSLNSGGLITRTIRSLPDDSHWGYMNTNFTIADFWSRDPNSTEEDSQHNQLLPHLELQRDYEADEFNISAPGISSRFHFDQNSQEFVFMPKNNLRIETIKDNLRIIGFIITDEKGFKYYFGKSSDNRSSGEIFKGIRSLSLSSETGFIESPVETFGSNVQFFQSWMLMEILSPKSEKSIKFTYVQENNVKTIQIQNENLILDPGVHEHTTNFSYREFNQPKISSIKFNMGEIDFIRNGPERMDLKNSLPLDEIKLFNNQSEPVKTWSFDTEIKTSSNENSVFDYFAEGPYRLFLRGLSLKDELNDIVYKYHFIYNTLNLPDRFSKKQDYFGFYNGADNNSLIPRGKYRTPGIVGDADRAVNPSFTQAGSLEKIIYPTGGFDVFVWENNYVSRFTGDASFYQDYLIQNLEYFTNDSYLFGDSDPNIDFSKTFTIAGRSTVNFETNMTGCSTAYNFNDNSCHYSIYIKGVSDPSFLLNIDNPVMNSTLEEGTYKIIALINDSAGSQGGGPDPNDPESGSGGNGPGGPPSIFGVRMSWGTDLDTTTFIYGGLRIAQINSFSSTNTLAFSRNFEYNLHDSPFNTSESGMALNFIDVSMNNWILPDGSLGLKISSNAPVPIPKTKGGFVGYRYVTETQSGNTTLGRIESTFSELNERFDNPYLGQTYFNSPFPKNYLEPLYNDWKAGNLEKKEIFDENDNLLERETYNYEEDEIYHSPQFGLKILRMGFSYGGIAYLYVAPYSYTTAYHRLKNIKTELFNTDNISQDKSMHYLSNPLIPSRIIVTKSDGIQIVTNNIYPSDVVSVSSLGLNSLTGLEKSAIDQLNTDHRIAEVVQTETFLDKDNDGQPDANERISTQRTNYKINSGIVQPFEVQSLKGEYIPNINELETRIVYEDYDSRGNPIAVKKADGPHIVYLWGYKGQYPIAKIENATISEIETKIGSVSNIDENDFIAINNLRSQLPNAMITTYEYEPLVGVTKITDSRGQAMTYEYDAFNRLKAVLDNDMKLLQEYKYHYKNQ